MVRKFFRPVFFSAALFLSLFGAQSCTREFTCQCVIKYSGQPGLPDSVIREYPIRDRKGTAEDLCSANSNTSVNNGIRTEETCELF